MVIGLLTLELTIPNVFSIKDKRQVLKSLKARLRNKFNISVAEVAEQDTWHVGVIGIACVSTDSRQAHKLLNRVAHWVEDARLDCDLADYAIEIL